VVGVGLGNVGLVQSALRQWHRFSALTGSHGSDRTRPQSVQAPGSAWQHLVGKLKEHHLSHR